MPFRWQAEMEVERLDALKSSKMKELVFKKRTELEDICRKAHMEPDPSTAPEKTNALIESGTLGLLLLPAIHRS